MLNQYNVLIVGVARNCGAEIASDIKRITQSFKDFAKVSWYVVESDSSDNTVEVLQTFKNSSFDFVSLGCLKDKMPQRTERLAYCRNKYVEYINQSKGVDYVAIVDLDGINCQLTVEAVRSCWSHKVKWDAAFANQSAPYYDVWALRHPLWSPNDFLDCNKFLLDLGIAPYQAYYSSLYERMLKIDPNLDPIKVDSAFGGLGIYKKKLFASCSYIGLDDRGNEVCEHVSLHEQMASKGADFYIIPSLINGGWNMHSSGSKFRHFLRRKLKGFIKKSLKFNS